MINPKKIKDKKTISTKESVENKQAKVVSVKSDDENLCISNAVPTDTEPETTTSINCFSNTISSSVSKGVVFGPDRQDNGIESRTFHTQPILDKRYVILDYIGAGGMGTVWKVRDSILQTTLALKVMHKHLMIDEAATKRFKSEALLATELTHANIAAIFGPGEDASGQPYIIMRYVDGESLAAILAKEGKLKPERAEDIFKQVCEALEYSHAKGIVHRDIKPSNIIIGKTSSGADLVYLVDFGIAKSIYNEQSISQALTGTSNILGSPLYMSPEQFLGHEVGPYSDYYSLGCVFYEMLTGNPPFSDSNPLKMVLQHLNNAPDCTNVPRRYRLLITCLLDKEISFRALYIKQNRRLLKYGVDLTLEQIKVGGIRALMMMQLLAYLVVGGQLSKEYVVYGPTALAGAFLFFWFGEIGICSMIYIASIINKDSLPKICRLLVGQVIGLLGYLTIFALESTFGRDPFASVWCPLITLALVTSLFTFTENIVELAERKSSRPITSMRTLIISVILVKPIFALTVCSLVCFAALLLAKPLPFSLVLLGTSFIGASFFDGFFLILFFCLQTRQFDKSKASNWKHLLHNLRGLASRS